MLLDSLWNRVKEQSNPQKIDSPDTFDSGFQSHLKALYTITIDCHDLKHGPTLFTVSCSDPIFICNKLFLSYLLVFNHWKLLYFLRELQPYLLGFLSIHVDHMISLCLNGSFQSGGHSLLGKVISEGLLGIFTNNHILNFIHLFSAISVIFIFKMIWAYIK
jgi:hypothetical protein